MRLTREREIEIAKTIEEGEEEILSSVLNSDLMINRVISLVDKLNVNKNIITDIVSDFDDEEFPSDKDIEKSVGRVVGIIEKIKETVGYNKLIKNNSEDLSACGSKNIKLKNNKQKNGLIPDDDYNSNIAGYIEKDDRVGSDEKEEYNIFIDIQLIYKGYNPIYHKI